MMKTDSATAQPTTNPIQEVLMLNAPCCYCDGEAKFLCDATIGFDAILDPESDPPRVCISGADGAHTCDAPLCGKCTIKSDSPITMCGSDGCEVVIDDYCHLHADWHSMRADMRPLTSGGLTAIREEQRIARARERLRRQRMDQVNRGSR